MLTNLDPIQERQAPPTDEATQASKRHHERRSSRLARFRFTSAIWRVCDLSLALCVAVIAVPVIALAALAVRLTSRGPAFYSQIRVGRGGMPFRIYKIRSMIHECESLTGPRWTIPGDPRVTPVGWFLRRTHIDELPQIWNVLKGEMSLIGPRPERPEFVRELAASIANYAERHTVLPGITGLAQVQLAPDTDLESVRRKLRYDLHYIDHASIGLNIRILLATVLHMLGASFERLQSLGLVPGPAIVEEITESEIESPAKLAA